MRVLVVLGGALGGLAFWRRKKLKSDAQKVASTARDVTSNAAERLSEARSGRSALYRALGEEVYASRTTDTDGDHEAEITRLIDEIAALDLISEQSAADEPDAPESEAVNA